MQQGKRSTSLVLDADLLDKAQDYGLNLSRWVNTKLNEFFNGGSVSNKLANGEVIPPGVTVDMDNGFRTWLKANRTDADYVKSLENYLNKYFKGLVLTSSQNIVDYLARMKTTSKYPILALRFYIKYLEETEQITAEKATSLKKVLKMEQSKPDSYVPNDEEIRKAHNKLKDKKDKLLFEILALSGVRVTEMVKMLKEFDEKNLTVQGSYARYSLNFKRGQKNSFFVYMPVEVAKRVKRLYKIDNKSLTKQLGKSGISPKYLRKWFYNAVILARVPESVADFMEGRSPATVGSSNYLAKQQQADYWYSEIVKTLNGKLGL